MNIEKRLQRMTPIQLQMLVDILSENPELISGKLTPNFTRTDRRNKWHALATLLNSKDLGPHKDADKWRKSWTDLKFAIRSKAAKIELAGGADLICEKLSNLEKRVLQMIGDVSTTDISGGCERESSSLTDEFPGEIDIDHKLVKKFEPNEIERNPMELVLPVAVYGDPDMTEGRIVLNDNENDQDGKDADNENEDDENDDESDGGDDDEFSEKNFNVSLHTPPTKRRKVSSESTFDLKATVIVLQKQLEIQTAVLKEQMHVMKDIAKSLRSIAKTLQK